MSIKSLTNLKRYCPTGTSEGEMGIRSDIFVPFSTWTNLVVPQPYSPSLLIGKKGSGKSILIDFTADVLQAKGIAFAKLLPRHLSLDDVPDGASVSQAHSHAYKVLVTATVVALGEGLHGVLNGTEKKLLDEAIMHGVAKDDVISKLAKFLPKLAKLMNDVDLTPILPEHTKVTSAHPDKLLRTALNETKTPRAVYILIDDTDQVASLNKPGHLNRIWGLLLAARELASISPEIRCLITMREEVWTRIANDKASQRDQTDHFYNLIKKLDPTHEELKLIVRRRLDIAKTASKEPSFTDRYDVFFEGNRPHMPGSDAVTSWEDLIVTRSRGRPRDCIQLLYLLADSAIKANQPKITDLLIANLFKGFSESRVDLLAQENEQEMPCLKEVIKSFAPRNIYDVGSFKASMASILNHVKSIPSMFSILLFGNALTSNNEESAFKLLSFLYRIGFVSVRKPRPNGQYLHILPAESPNYVSEANRNELQNVSWEIHPAYRDFLIEQQHEVLYRR